MKKILSYSLLAGALLLSASGFAQQDKSKRASPPAKVSQTLNSGQTITIEYSQPSVKGRTIGTDLEPKAGKVWRMGANEATTFETDKDLSVNGKTLPAGKYSLFGLQEGENGFTLIFNKEWKIWGTNYEANKEKDVLQVPAAIRTVPTTQETLTYTIEKGGAVRVLWGNKVIEFKVN